MRIVLAMLMTLLLVGCSDTDSQSNTTQASQPEQIV